VAGAPTALIEWSARSELQARRRFAQKLLGLLPSGSDVLELGCGAGFPVTHTLAQRFNVTAIEADPRLLALARVNVPGAQLEEGDWKRAGKERAAFDAVVAMYVLAELPPRSLLPQLKRVGSWMRRGALLVANRPVAIEGAIEQAWPGAPVTFARVDALAALAVVAGAGLEPVESEVITDEDAGGQPISFLWFVARKR
jgi:SAM-dependent methyltransferase